MSHHLHHYHYQNLTYTCQASIDFDKFQKSLEILRKRLFFMKGTECKSGQSKDLQGIIKYREFICTKLESRQPASLNGGACLCPFLIKDSNSLQEFF